MPKYTTVSALELTATGAIAMTFGMVQEADGEIVRMTPLRRIVEPNGDIDANCDDVSDYLAQSGYPAINADMRTLIKAVDAAARAYEPIEVARAKWIEDWEKQQEAMNPPEQAA